MRTTRNRVVVLAAALLATLYSGACSDDAERMNPMYVAVANCDPNIEGRCAVSPYALEIVEVDEPEEEPEPEPEPEPETLQPPRIEWVSVNRWIWAPICASQSTTYNWTKAR